MTIHTNQDQQGSSPETNSTLSLPADLRKIRVGTNKEKEEKGRGGRNLLPNGSFCTDHKGKGGVGMSF